MQSWSVIGKYWDFVVHGLTYTLIVSGVALLGAVGIGLVACGLRLSRFAPVRFLGGLYVDVFRSTPLFVQLLWLFYALPILIGFSFSTVTAAAIGLSLYEGSYFTEVFRAGVLSVPAGQREAALAQGMTSLQALRRVVLPQAVRKVVPPAVSSTVTLIKDSSLASVIGVTDLMWQANELASSSFRPFQVITFVAVLYAALTYPLTLAGNYLQRRLVDPSLAKELRRSPLLLLARVRLSGR